MRDSDAYFLYQLAFDMRIPDVPSMAHGLTARQVNKWRSWYQARAILEKEAFEKAKREAGAS